jgi:hypothetical protein
MSDGIATYFVETIREDGLYTGKCPQGHDLLIATQTLRHEMLFEIALNAIEDGYYREAVSSFTASMERYFEFAIRVLARNRNVPVDVFGEVWKVIGRQSERQLGAYVALYAAIFGNIPLVLCNKLTKQRNDVIHNGKVPTKDQALEFGNSVHSIIQSGFQNLREVCLDQVTEEISDHVERIAQNMGSKYPRSFQMTTTALNSIEDISNGYKTFEKIISERGIS